MPYDEIVKNILTATSREGMTADEWTRVKKVDDGKTFDTNDYATGNARPVLAAQQNVPPISGRRRWRLHLSA
jgi:hypothetical protein